MKKLLLVLLVAVVAMVGSFETKACTAPYVPATVSVTINGCVFTVDVCVYCGGASFFGGMEIQSISIPPCNYGMPLPEALARVVKYLYTEGGYRQMCGSPIPPCNKGSISMTYLIPQCYELHVLLNGSSYCTPCTGTNYCQIDWSICWDEATLSYITTEIYTPIYGTSSCIYIPNPLDGDCFKVSTPCF